jgi:hypothetical protein
LSDTLLPRVDIIGIGTDELMGGFEDVGFCCAGYFGAGGIEVREPGLGEVDGGVFGVEGY